MGIQKKTESPSTETKADALDASPLDAIAEKAESN